MFEHSVKVPRHYKTAANIFRKVSTEGASVKTLLHDDKLKHHRVNVLYALVTETIKHSANLDQIFEYIKIFEKEPRLDPWLAKILTTELLFGKKALPGESKPVQTILSYSSDFEKYMCTYEHQLKTKVTRKPRYVRINTNLLTTSDAIRAYQDQGYRFIRCTSGSYSDYLEQINNLSELDFTQDYHVKTVFVFAAGTKFHDDEFYLEKKVLLQDKATSMPVHLLAPPQGSVVLDMCAAPGMKTTQVAAFLRNTGRVYAVERDEKRFKTLSDFLKTTGCERVEALNKDVLEIGKGEMSDVEYIILDPSCSGSGMDFCLYNYKDNEERLKKLTSLQEKLLKHAMNAFPSAKKIVYSTCSVYPEENERVVLNVLKASRAKWRLLDGKELLNEQWDNYGSNMYGSLGTRCIYTKPEKDLTIGFFMAVLERKENDREHTENIQSDVMRRENEHPVVIEKSKQNRPRKEKKTKNPDYDENQGLETVDCASVNLAVSTRESAGDKIPKKSKKKKHGEQQDVIESVDSNVAIITGNSDEISLNKSKKRNRVQQDQESVHTNCSSIENGDLDNLYSETGASTKKKKKDKIRESSNDTREEADIIKESKKKKHKKGDDARDAEVAESQINSDITPKEEIITETYEVLSEMAIDNSLGNGNSIPTKKKKKMRNN